MRYFYSYKIQHVGSHIIYITLQELCEARKVPVFHFYHLLCDHNSILFFFFPSLQSLNFCCLFFLFWSLSYCAFSPPSVMYYSVWTSGCYELSPLLVSAASGTTNGQQTTDCFRKQNYRENVTGHFCPFINVVFFYYVWVFNTSY